jgi:hypothetical protein
MSALETLVLFKKITYMKNDIQEAAPPSHPILEGKS